MLPRLRFVVAALAIAILPMVLLSSGVFPTPHTAPTMEIPRADKPVSLGPNEYSEARYRQDRMVLAYARRANELSRLRELASVPLDAWVAAPSGAEVTTPGHAGNTESAPAAPAAPPATGTPSANESRTNESRARDIQGEVVATLSLAKIAAETAVETPSIPLSEIVAEPRALPAREKPAVTAAETLVPVPVKPCRCRKFTSP